MPSTKHASGPHPEQVRRVGPEEIWADLMEGNRRFQAGNPVPRDLARRRAELARSQAPQAVVLTCSDSRVSPNLLFDKNLGDLFVIRTAGNVAGAVALGSIEYTVEYLHSKVLVVLGHENCGAVAAAASGQNAPSANIESIIARVRPAVERVQGSVQGDDLLRLAEQANVHQSAASLLEESPLLAGKVAAGDLTIIKAIYYLSTGLVVRLPD